MKETTKTVQSPQSVMKTSDKSNPPLLYNGEEFHLFYLFFCFLFSFVLFYFGCIWPEAKTQQNIPAKDENTAEEEEIERGTDTTF